MAGTTWHLLVDFCAVVTWMSSSCSQGTHTVQHGPDPDLVSTLWITNSLTYNGLLVKITTPASLGKLLASYSHGLCFCKDVPVLIVSSKLV